MNWKKRIAVGIALSALVTTLGNHTFKRLSEMTALSTLKHSAAAILALAVIAVSPLAAAGAAPDRGDDGTLGVRPALAGATLPDYGSSVLCRYRTNSPGPAFTARLKTIVVAPPRMFSNSGRQTVGWRFVVRRTIDEGHGYPSHHVTYRSPIQTAKATTVNAADFRTMRVGVALPTTVEDPRDVYYQVVIRMIRYRPDGSVKSTISYLMPDYTVRVKGNGWAYTESGYEVCDGLQWAAV